MKKKVRTEHTHIRAKIQQKNERSTSPFSTTEEKVQEDSREEERKKQQMHRQNFEENGNN